MATTFASLVDNLIVTIGFFVPLVIAMALAVFLYGLVIYLNSSGSEEKRKDSIHYIVLGIVGLFVMLAVWALVSLLSNTFGFPVGIPQIS